MKKDIKLSPRSKVRLKKEEMDFLKKYTSDDPAAYTNIKNNTGIARLTVVRIVERGWAELSVALPLRDFINRMKEYEYL